MICSPEPSGNHGSNGLEVIEEEDTDRTIVSSGHSGQKNQFSNAKITSEFRQEQGVGSIVENN